MKGMVFTELLEMAEGAVGEAAVDDILDACPLESGGAYNAVGNYPCGELMTIVGALSDHTGAPVAELQRQFGHWMHGRFVERYAPFYEGKADAFEMLEAIEAEVHVEVRKLHPDVELPTFETTRPAPDVLVMTYRSPRALADFCHGLIEACVAHFGAPVDIEMGAPWAEGTTHAAQFKLMRAGV